MSRIVRNAHDIVLTISEQGLERQFRTGFGIGGLPVLDEASIETTIGELAELLPDLPAEFLPEGLANRVVIVGMAFAFGYPVLELTDPSENGTDSSTLIRLPFDNSTLFLRDFPRLGIPACGELPENICGLSGHITVSAPLEVTAPVEDNGERQRLVLNVSHPDAAIGIRLDQSSTDLVNGAFGGCPISWEDIAGLFVGDSLGEGLEGFARDGVVPLAEFEVHGDSADPTAVKKVCPPQILRHASGGPFLLLPIVMTRGCSDAPSADGVLDVVEAEDETAIIINNDFLIGEIIRPQVAEGVLEGRVPDPPGVTEELIDTHFERPLQLAQHIELFDIKDENPKGVRKLAHARAELIWVTTSIDNNVLEIKFGIDGAAGFGFGDDILLSGHVRTTIAFDAVKGQPAVWICQQEPSIQPQMTLLGFVKSVIVLLFLPILNGTINAWMAAWGTALAIQLGGRSAISSHTDFFPEAVIGTLEEIGESWIVVDGDVFMPGQDANLEPLEEGERVTVEFRRAGGIKIAENVYTAESGAVAGLADILLVKRAVLDDLLFAGELRLAEAASILWEQTTPSSSQWSIDLDPERPTGQPESPELSSHQLHRAELRWQLGRGVSTDNGAEVVDLGTHPRWQAENIGQVDLRLAEGYRHQQLRDSVFPSEPPNSNGPTDPCNPSDSQPELSVRVLGLRSESNLFARLLCWRDRNGFVRCALRAYRRPFRRLTIKRDWNRSRCKDGRVGVEEGMVPRLIGSLENGFRHEMIPHEFEYQDCEYSWSGVFTAKPHDLGEPVEFEWQVRLPDGTIIDLIPEDEVEVEREGASVFYTVIDEGQAVEVRTDQGATGSFKLRLKATERGCFNWQTTTTVHYEGQGREEGEKLAAAEELRNTVDRIVKLAGLADGEGRPGPEPDWRLETLLVVAKTLGAGRGQPPGHLSQRGASRPSLDVLPTNGGKASRGQNLRSDLAFNAVAATMTLEERRKVLKQLRQAISNLVHYW